MQSFVVAVVVAVAVVATVVVADGTKPCLPDQWQANGVDSQLRGSYLAMDYHKQLFGMRRPPTNKLLKDYGNKLRYYITPGGCNKTALGSEFDVPQCVPDNATVVDTPMGQMWEFTNVDGATWHYKKTDRPDTYVVKKISPNHKEYLELTGFVAQITDPHVFLLPKRCQ